MIVIMLNTYRYIIRLLLSVILFNLVSFCHFDVVIYPLLPHHLQCQLVYGSCLVMHLNGILHHLNFQ